MESILTGIIFAVAGLAVVLVVLSATGLAVPIAILASREERRMRERLQKRAARLGLVRQRPLQWLVPIRGRDAVLGLIGDPSQGAEVTRPCLHLPVPTAGLRIRRRRELDDLATISDPELADWLVASGTPEDRAILTGEVRAALAALRSWCNVSIAQGKLWVYLVRPGPGFERLEDGIAAAGRIVSALERVPADPVERLVRMATHDPIPALRASALARLASAYATYPALREVARRLADDPAPAARVEAALVLRDRDRLLRLAIDPDVPGPVRHRAARGIASGDAHPALGEVVALLGANDATVRRAGLRLAKEAGADAEPILIERLAPGEPLVAGMVEALGDIGTVRSLDPLRALHAAASSLGSLRGLVEGAIARIRTREESRIGALAVAAPVGGELSVVVDSGALSVARTPESA